MEKQENSVRVSRRNETKRTATEHHLGHTSFKRGESKCLSNIQLPFKKFGSQSELYLIYMQSFSHGERCVLQCFVLVHKHSSSLNDIFSSSAHCQTRGFGCKFEGFDKSLSCLEK